MFKDSFTLKKRSWHARLMKFTWNLSTRDFSHICPYFWLTIANIILFCSCITPLIFGVKSTFKGIGYLIEALHDWNRQSYERAMEKKITRLREDSVFFEDFVEYWHSEKKPSVFRKLERFMRDHSYTYSDIYTKISNAISQKRERDTIAIVEWEPPPETQEQILAKFEAAQKLEDLERKSRRLKREAEERKRLAAIARKRRINAILKVVKPIVKAFVYLAGICVLGLAGYALFTCVKMLGTVKHETYMTSGKYIGYVLAGGVVVFGVVMGIGWLMNNVSLNIGIGERNKQRLEKLGLAIIYPFVKTIDGFIWVAKGIGKILEITGNVIRNNCPAIEWKD